MISSISISGFRGISRTLTLPLAQITLLSGRNGLGKTTFFDAIDWCLFGRSWRLGAEGNSHTNLYHPGAPEVAIHIRTATGAVHRLRRTSAAVTLNGEELSDRELMLHFVRDPDVFGPYARGIEARIRRLLYLPQAEIRDFLRPTSDTERVAILQSLLGVPNIAVVEKSARRLIDRIVEREQRTRDRLKEIRSDLATVRADISPIYDHGGFDRSAELRYARSVLGTGAGQIESVDGLLAAAQAQRTTIQARRREIEELRSWLTDIGEARPGLTESINRHKEDIERLQTELNSLADAQDEKHRVLDELRATLHDVTHKLEAHDADIDTLRRLDARLGSLEEARARIDELRSNIGAAESALEALRHDVHTADTQWAEARTQLSNAGTKFKAWQLADGRRREAARLKGQMGALQAALLSSRTNSEALRRQVDDAEHTLRETHTRLQAADDHVRTLLAAAPLDQRFSRLLEEIRSLLPHQPSGRCPLCGHDHHDAATLLRRVEEAAADRADQAAAITQATTELQRLQEERQKQDAALIKSRHVMAAEENHYSEIQRQLDLHAASLSGLGNLGPEAEHNALGLQLEDDIRDAEGNVAAALQRLNELRATLENESAAANRLREELSIAAASEDDLTQELAGQGTPPSGRDVRGRLSLAEQGRVQLRSLAEQTEGRVADEMTAIRRLEELSRETRQQLVDMQARLSSEVQHLNDLSEQATARVSGAVGPIPDDPDAALSALITELRDQDAKLRRVTVAMESLRAVQAQDDRRTRIAALESHESELEVEGSRLLRAKERFQTIKIAITARAEKEAQDALVHHTVAIQRCLDALLPHRHLNRVVWDNTTGAILLTDHRLGGAVRPDLYSSTGQLNVLALAVFIGVALLQRVTTFSFLALDEPIQNLDDVHFLAFIALIKRISLPRQIILSTADANVAEIVRRQLKTSADAGGAAYVQYEWRAFDPVEGPEVVSVAQP